MDVDKEGGNWWEEFKKSLTPVQLRNMERHRKYVNGQFIIARWCRWLRWPIINIVWTFWPTLWEEGIRSTLKPRWGAMTFCYLNDGMKPTLWHLFMGIFMKDNMIYPKGAPTFTEWRKERNESKRVG